MPEQWPRALLRGALRESCYDAVGTRSLESAARIPVREAGRGPVSLIVVDQDALKDDTALASLEMLLQRHGSPPTLLVAHATRAPSERAWSQVVRRPVSVDDLVREISRVLPLPESTDRLGD